MLQLAYILPLIWGLAGDLPAAQCSKFEDCLRQALKAQTPIEQALYASRGIQLYEKRLPQRDLVNLLNLRAGALVRLYIANPTNQALLNQAANDYQQLKGFLPGSYLPLAGMARIAELKADLKQAEQLFGEAVKTKDLLAWLERTAYFLRQHQPDKAFKDLQSAEKRMQELIALEREIHPQHKAWFHELKGQTLNLLGQTEAASAELKTACEMGAKSACAPEATGP